MLVANAVEIAALKSEQSALAARVAALERKAS
jgi:hypothetical protein